MRTIAKVSENTLKIEGFLNGKNPGSFISYEEIATATGVSMDEKGKAFMRSALNRLKLEYSVVAGEGIELAAPTNGMQIISNRLVRVNNSVKRAGKSHSRIQEQFWSDMSPDDQRKVLFVGSIFGAIRLAAENGRHIYGNKKETPRSINMSIPVPSVS